MRARKVEQKSSNQEELLWKKNLNMIANQKDYGENFMGEKTYSRRRWLEITGGAVAGLAAGAAVGYYAGTTTSPKETAVLRIPVFGGSWERNFMAHFADPYMKMHPEVKIVPVPTTSMDAFSKIRAAGGVNPPFDMAILDSIYIAMAIEEGLVIPYDLDILTNLELWHEFTWKRWYDEYGEVYVVLHGLTGFGYEYRTDLVPKPDGWLSIWEDAYKGQIAIVPFTDILGHAWFIGVVRSLGGVETNEADVDAAFEKIKELKGRIAAFPTSQGLIETAMIQGDYGITPNGFHRAYELADRTGTPVDWAPCDPSLVVGNGFGICKGTEVAEECMAFENFLLSPEPQAAYHSAMWDTGGCAAMWPYCSEKYTEKVIFVDDLFNIGLYPDYIYIGEHVTEWQQRFEECVT